MIGGILQAADIPDFLGNLSAFKSAGDPESNEWETFIRSWYEHFSSNPVATSSLFPIARGVLALIDRPDLKNDHARKTAFGAALRSQDGKRVGEHFVWYIGKDSQNTSMYRLQPVAN